MNLFYLIYKTLTDEEEELSATLSSFVEKPLKLPGAMPFENNKFPIIVVGPPVLLPFMAISMILLEFSGIISVPLLSDTTPFLLIVIVQPSGNTCPVSGMLTNAVGKLICGLILYIPKAFVGLVLFMLTSKKNNLSFFYFTTILG